MQRENLVASSILNKSNFRHSPVSAILLIPFLCFTMYTKKSSAYSRRIGWALWEKAGSLSKHDDDGSENVIWKCNFAFLQSFFDYSVIMFEKCVLTILELNWNQRLGHKTKLNICHHMLTSSKQLQNRSFHVIERTRTSSKCQKLKTARAKRAKILFFIVKYANLFGFCCRRRRGCLSSLAMALRARRLLFALFLSVSFPFLS